jgi:CRISPR-associated protein Csb1
MSATIAPALSEANRILLEATLLPVQGARFQPTGFPDLGPARFNAGKTEMLLVESAQSMANRLEECGWDAATARPVPPLQGLPYVRVVDTDGGFLSGSRLEAHRLAAARIRDSHLPTGALMRDVLRDRLGIRDGVPMDHRAIARAIFGLDPLSLLHGVFFAIKEWPFQPKVSRIVSSFIEASDVRDAYSGGLKRDDVMHKVKGSEESAESGYGNVPYARHEFTAGRIVAYFNIDLTQLRGFGLDPRAESLLETLAQWEIRRLLDRSLRLRTACDLEPTEIRATRPDGYELPVLRDLEATLRERAEACAPLFEKPLVLECVWQPKPKAAKQKADQTEADAEQE